VKLPFIISIPHCSDRIPDPIRPAIALNHDEIGDSVDWGTREIFGSLDAEDVLWASWSRLVVDLNRAPERRDEKGVIPEIDYSSRTVYRPGMAPAAPEIDERLAAYYWPYHQQLSDVLQKDHIKGLFDVHSLYGMGPSEAPDAGRKRKDIVLSNNGGRQGEETPYLGCTTCGIQALHMMRRVFVNAGFSVALNDPYTAGYITTHYGRGLTQRGRFAVQIEVNQDLFTTPGSITMIPEKLAAAEMRIRQCLYEIAAMI
jgi:N-formylglutamate deformylase